MHCLHVLFVLTYLILIFSCINSISQILSHPFLNSTVTPSIQPMQYHVFISHMQIESSGNVGTMFFMLGEMGCHAWRDMNQIDITTAAMKQGVLDSDVFVLFLTNAVLTRPFCLKEIGWALDANKPIVIVAEEEERFWPFDIERWKKDECTKDTTVWPHTWKKSNGLGSDYASCPANIKTEIQRQHDAGLILPYRRRDFEANGMILEVLKKAGELGCEWAKHVPHDALSSSESSINTISGTRKLLVVCDTTQEAGASTMVIRQSINDELKQTLAQCNVDIVDNVEEATHALVVLTGGLLRNGSLSMLQLDGIVNRLGPLDIIYTHSEDAGWDFDVFYGRPDSKLKSSIAGHESLKYRPNNLARGYEHTSMVSEVLRRFRPHSSGSGGGNGVGDSSVANGNNSLVGVENKESKMDMISVEEKKQELTLETKKEVAVEVQETQEELNALDKQQFLDKIAALEQQAMVSEAKIKEAEARIQALEQELSLVTANR
jgi:hypothetical protein